MEVKGFIIQRGYEGKEETAVALYCTMNRIPYHRIEWSKKKQAEIPDGYVPCGCIEWVYNILKQTIRPIYYPEFLKPYLLREVWETNEWPLRKRVFIKPADKHKRFTGFITNKGYRGKKKGPYWCSDILHFDDEWRYYVSNGKVITGEWYSGDQINCPDAPSIDHIEFPNNYCGVVDFGMTDKGLALVEANEPFSCGWYGKDHNKYAEWLVSGWHYMLNKYKISKKGN